MHYQPPEILRGKRHFAFLASMEFLTPHSSSVMAPWKSLSCKHAEALLNSDSTDNSDINGDRSDNSNSDVTDSDSKDKSNNDSSDSVICPPLWPKRNKK
jgi:hypothetical protein